MDIIKKYNIHFPTNLHYEDANFYWKYMLLVKKAYFIDKYLYNYRRRENSIMANTFSGCSFILDHLHILEDLHLFFAKNNILNKYKKLFCKIFKTYTLFVYYTITEKEKLNTLKLAQKYAKDFFPKDNPTIFVKYLKKGKFSNLLEVDLNLLQKIFSIKKVSILYSADVYRKLTFFGLEFRYKNKVDNLERMLLKQNERFIYQENLLNDKQKQIDYLNNRINEQQFQLDRLNHINTIQTFGFYNGDDFVKSYSLGESFIRQLNNDDFYKLCNKYFAFRELKEFHPHEVLIYINACLNTNRIEKAQNLLNEYVNIFGLDEIWRFLPVAKFAKEQGITDENIEKAAFVFNKLEENRKNKLFEKLVEGKTIAVVGNGPSEIGKGKGAEIDSHDIVIRMNNYKTEGYEQDYGSKTDIWVKCSSDDIEHELRDENIQLIVYEPDYKRHIVIDGYLEALDENLRVIDYFDFEDHLKLRTKLNIFPSTGLVLVEKLLTCCNVAKLDLYGFSFLQEIQDGYATHYFKDRSDDESKARSSHHSFNEEAEYLKKLVRG